MAFDTTDHPSYFDSVDLSWPSRPRCRRIKVVSPWPAALLSYTECSIECRSTRAPRTYVPRAAP